MHGLHNFGVHASGGVELVWNDRSVSSAWRFHGGEFVLYRSCGIYCGRLGDVVH